MVKDKSFDKKKIIKFPTKKRRRKNLPTSKRIQYRTIVLSSTKSEIYELEGMSSFPRVRTRFEMRRVQILTGATLRGRGQTKRHLDSKS